MLHSSVGSQVTPLHFFTRGSVGNISGSKRTGWNSHGELLDEELQADGCTGSPALFTASCKYSCLTSLLRQCELVWLRCRGIDQPILCSVAAQECLLLYLNCRQKEREVCRPLGPRCMMKMILLLSCHAYTITLMSQDQSAAHTFPNNKESPKKTKARFTAQSSGRHWL